MARRKNPRGHGRKPGQSAREHQKALASVNPRKTFFTRRLGIPTAEQSWGAGAEGEEHVGRILNQLAQAGWLVMHDLQVSRSGKNVDHLVIGPPGVFVVETKNVSGAVRVDGPDIQVNGYAKDYVEKLEWQALQVREELLSRVGWESLWVQGLLVFVAPDLRVNKSPKYVEVLTDKALLAALTNWEPQLSSGDMRELAQATRAIWR